MARRLGTVLCAFVLTLLMAAGSAEAGTRTVKDEKGPAKQWASNSLVKATLKYTEERTVFRLKVKRLSKKLTRGHAGVLYSDGSVLLIDAFHRKNGTKVTDATFIDDDTAVALPAGVTTSRWNYRRDVLIISVDSTQFDPKPANRRAVLEAYTRQKGRQVPPCPVKTPCNDDYVSALLKR